MRTSLGALLVAAVVGAVVTAALPFIPARAVWHEADSRNPVAGVRVVPAECLDGEAGGIPTTPVECRLHDAGRGRPTVVVWGDSHAWQQLPAMRIQAERTRTNLVAFVMGACPPAQFLDGSVDGPCARTSALALRSIRERVDRRQRVKVLLGAFWGYYRDLLRRADAGWSPTTDNERFLLERARLYEAGTPQVFATLAAWDVPTAAIGQMPWVPESAPPCDAGVLPYACDLPRATAIGDERRTRAWVERQLARLPRGGYIDTTGYLCDADTCRARLGDRPAYLDELHLDPAVTGRFHRAYADFFATPR